MGDLTVRTGRPRARLFGRDGVGKATLGAALRAHGVAVTDGPADAHLYCFAGGLRATDRATIGALDRGQQPLIVVWTRADAAGSWRAADDYTDRLAELIERPVLPVMALLDGVDDSVDVAALRRIAESALALPEPADAAAAALGTDAPLLLRLGGYGLACAIGALRETPSLSDGELLDRLRALSGVDSLLAPLAAAYEGHEARREAEFDDGLRAVARTDCARRDRVEQLLLDRLARAS